jgi:hypothetical protein
VSTFSDSSGRTYDSTNQSDRADARKAGYYIDNSGVYSPGSGARVGDTWGASGGTANGAHQTNAPDDGHRLPVIGGHPVSPSNGFTGAQTPYIMYRGDPLYQQFFGPGTPGFSSAPTPWAPGQFASWNGQDPMNFLGRNASSPDYQNALASGANQTPFADFLKANGLSMVGMPSYNPSTGGMQDNINTVAKPGGVRQNAQAQS